MNKILFSVTVLLVIFSFNLSYSQDVDIDRALASLSSKIVDNYKKLDSILGDLLTIGKAAHGDQPMTISAIVGDLEAAQIVYELQNCLIFAKMYVRRDDVKNYYGLLMQSLSSSKLAIDNSYRKMQVSYPYITNKAALHSADKAKKIIKDSITEIESTIKTLDSAIKSMQ